MAKVDDKEFVVVRFAAASMEEPYTTEQPAAAAVVPFSMLRFRAKSEEDVYYHMVMTDVFYSFYSQVHQWSKGWYQPLLGPIFDPLSNTVKEELTTAITRIEKCEQGWATAAEIIAKLPRSWITPAIAKRMWTISNDARDGATQDAAPYKHREAAQLFALDSIPSSSLVSSSSSK